MNRRSHSSQWSCSQGSRRTSSWVSGRREIAAARSETLEVARYPCRAGVPALTMSSGEAVAIGRPAEGPANFASHFRGPSGHVDVRHWRQQEMCIRWARARTGTRRARMRSSHRHGSAAPTWPEHAGRPRAAADGCKGAQAWYPGDLGRQGRSSCHAECSRLPCGQDRTSPQAPDGARPLRHAGAGPALRASGWPDGSAGWLQAARRPVPGTMQTAKGARSTCQADAGCAVPARSAASMVARPGDAASRRAILARCSSGWRQADDVVSRDRHQAAVARVWSRRDRVQANGIVSREGWQGWRDSWS